MDDEDLARAYLEHYRRGLEHERGVDEETFQGWVDVHQVLRKDPEKAWKIVLKLVELAMDDDGALAYIGAGPLEDLVTWYPNPYLDVAEAEAIHNRPLATALATARYPGHP